MAVEAVVKAGLSLHFAATQARTSMVLSSSVLPTLLVPGAAPCAGNFYLRQQECRPGHSAPGRAPKSGTQAVTDRAATYPARAIACRMAPISAA
jgi:hypothetical protein